MRQTEEMAASDREARLGKRPEVVQGISYPVDDTSLPKNDMVEGEMPPPTPEQTDRARLFSLSTFKIALPVILLPTIFGYNLGYVGPYITLSLYATNCQLYGAKTSCETLSNAKCRWAAASAFVPGATQGEVCGWADTTTCFLQYTDEVTCGGDSACVWSYSQRTCGNRVGYTSIQSGLFAGSMIIGTILGGFTGGYLTKWLDYRKSFFLIGVISIVSAVMTHVATGIFQYWLLFAARIVLGFAMGWQSITSPHYTDKFSPTSLRQTMGTFFQVAAAFGSFVAAVFAICLGNTIQYKGDRDARVMARMQGLTAPSTLLSVLVLFLPLITRDGFSGSVRDDIDEDALATPEAVKKYSVRSMIGPLCMGAVIACTMQLTGISANINFAPTIMANLGLDGLVGNIIVMAWNSAAAFCVIPLSKRFSIRTLFLFCGLVGSLCCIFLSGVPVYPGVTKVARAKDIIGIVGIGVFIACFAAGIGPCFFVLSVIIFPPSFRPIGSSFTMGVMFAVNLVINICYPIATEGISGGPSGEQDKGQAVAFIFFGCIGLVTVVIEYFFLHPWEDEESVSREEPLSINGDVAHRQA